MCILALDLLYFTLFFCTPLYSTLLQSTLLSSSVLDEFQFYSVIIRTTAFYFVMVDFQLDFISFIADTWEYCEFIFVCLSICLSVCLSIISNDSLTSLPLLPHPCLLTSAFSRVPYHFCPASNPYRGDRHPPSGSSSKLPRTA